jgi:hypothetical protein
VLDQEVVTEVQPEVKLDVDKPAEVVQVDAQVGALETALVGASNGITSEDIPVVVPEVKPKGRKAKG